MQLLDDHRGDELNGIVAAAPRVMAESMNEGPSSAVLPPEASISSSGIAPDHDKEDIRTGTPSDRTYRMRRAILNLEQLSDIDLFESLSDGMRDRTRVFRVSVFNRGFAVFGLSPKLVLVNETRTSNAQLYDYRRNRAEFQFVRQF